MKYSEFRRLVKDMNYDLGETKETIYVREKVMNRSIAYVGKDRRFIFSFYTVFDELRESEQEALFYLVTEIAKTSPEEREEIKLYRLKFVGHVDDGYEYLNILMDKRAMDVVSLATIFTESELKDIDETGFIREEVTE